MKFEMTAPCAKCPFRTDVTPYLRRDRAKEIANGLWPQQQTFPCHATVDYSDGEEPTVPATAQHCAGAMIVLEAMNRPNQMMRIAERFGLYDHRKLAKDAPVFATLKAFVAAQRITTVSRRGSSRLRRQHGMTTRA